MKKIPYMTLLAFVILCIVCLILASNYYSKNNDYIELASEFDAYKKTEKLSDLGKNFILSYAKGSQEYKKYTSDDFYVKGEAALEEENHEENHNEYADEVEVNYLLSNTTYSKREGYITSVLYEYIEKMEGFEMGVVLFKATLFWNDEDKITDIDIELIS